MYLAFSQVYWTVEGNSRVLSVARPQVFKCVTLSTSTPGVPMVSLFLPTQEAGSAVTQKELSDVLVLEHIAFSTTLDPVISASTGTVLTQTINCAGANDSSVDQTGADVVSVQNGHASNKKEPQGCKKLDLKKETATNKPERLAPGEEVVPKKPGGDNLSHKSTSTELRETHSKKCTENRNVVEISRDSRTQALRNESTEDMATSQSISIVPKKKSNHDESVINNNEVTSMEAGVNTIRCETLLEKKQQRSEKLCQQGDSVPQTGGENAVKSKPACMSDHRKTTGKMEWAIKKSGDDPKSGGPQNKSNSESSVAEHFRKLIKKLSKMSFEHPKVLITIINSPSEFFVHCISDLTFERISIISSCLKDYLSHLRTVDMAAESHRLVVKVGAVCCGLFSEDDTLYRAMVIKVRECETEMGKTTRVFLTYLDYGNSEWLSSDRLFPLPKEIDLSVMAPSAVRCRLACLMPPLPEGFARDSMADISDNWTMKAREQFLDLTGFVKCFKMFVVPESSDDLTG